MKACGLNFWLSGCLKGFGRVGFISLCFCKVGGLIRWWSFKSCLTREVGVVQRCYWEHLGAESGSEAGVKSLS